MRGISRRAAKPREEVLPVIKLPDWLTPRPRRLATLEPEPEAPPTPGSSQTAGHGLASAGNLGRQVIDLVRPHLGADGCLIVTGYQDFLSSMGIIMTEVPEIAFESGPSVRLAFGVNTEGARHMPGRGRPAPEIARRHFLGRHGITVEDQAEHAAALALEAVRAGRIDLRVFDPAAAAGMRSFARRKAWPLAR